MTEQSRAELTATDPRSVAVSLPDGSASMEFILEAGGLINRLVLSAGDQRLDVVAGIDPARAAESNPQYRGVALFPFPNRLAGGAFEFNGKRYQFPINEQENNNALHGFLFRLPPEVIGSRQEEDTASLSLLYSYDGSLPGYPFSSTVQMDYQLSRESLTVRMTVNNKSDAAMPVGIGWHPYLCLGRELVDDLLLQMPVAERYCVNDRMLPSGETSLFSDFSAPRPVGTTQFDDCFRLEQTSGTASVVLWSEQYNLGLDIWQDVDSGLNYLQLCIPPDRQSIAVEPMSCGIDAFNTGQDVEVIQPGHSFAGVFGIRLTTRKP